MSLDVTVAFSTAYAVSAFTAADEDILRWDPTDGFELAFGGSGVVGGMNFDDDDVLEYDTQSGDWEMSVDGSAKTSNWGAADLDAFHADRSCDSLGGDSDGDKLCDDEDPCVSLSNTLPVLLLLQGAPNADLNGDGVPNECQCGDPNGTGDCESADLFEAFNCIENDPENATAY